MSDFFKLSDLAELMDKPFKVLLDKSLHYMIITETPSGSESYHGNTLTQLIETLKTLDPKEVSKIVLI